MNANLRYLETALCWGRPVIEGSGPCARGGHTAVLAGTYLVIFGGHYYGGSGIIFPPTQNFSDVGFKGTFTYMNDTYCLDIKTLTWHQTRPVGDVPPGRYGHSATLVRDR